MFARKHSLAGLLIWVTFAFAAGADDTKPVSFYHDVVPILKRSCTGCHHPDKLKGELDLTTYTAFLKAASTDLRSNPADRMIAASSRKSAGRNRTCPRKATR